MTNISGTRKRFYRTTGIVQNDSNWEVTLDHRRLKTPNGKVFSVVNEQLARAVAAEWDAQSEFISQPTMHIVSSLNLYYYILSMACSVDLFIFAKHKQENLNGHL